MIRKKGGIKVIFKVFLIDFTFGNRFLNNEQELAKTMLNFKAISQSQHVVISL